MSGAARLRGVFGAQSRALLVALGLLLLAIFAPPVKLPRRTYDSIVVFDITQSMNVEDYELAGVPISRLDFAREAARRSLRELPCGSRLGWAVFSGYRTLLLLAPVEVCVNYNDLLAALDNIDGRMRWANASEISKGVYWSLRAAKAVGGKPSVIFLTDGQEAPPVDPAYPPQPFDDLKAGEIHGWLMGTGGETPQRIPRTDADGRSMGFWRSEDVLQRYGDTAGSPNGQPREQLSGLREAHLQALAHQVGLDYAPLSTVESLGRAMRDPGLAERHATPTDLSWLLACAALASLTWCFRPDFSRSGRGRRAQAARPTAQ